MANLVQRFPRSQRTSVLSAGLVLLMATSGLTQAEVEVGVTAAVNRQALGTPPSSQTRLLALGDEIIFNERIQTNSEGLLQILLVDGTTFTVSSGSDLVIDRFVYDPDTGTGELVATFGRGAMRFIGGQLSKDDDGVTVNAPIGTIGIRGGMANILVDPVGSDGRVSGRVDNLYGTVDVTLPNGQRRNLFTSNTTLEIEISGIGTDGGSVDTAIERTEEDDLALIQEALEGNPSEQGGADEAPTDLLVAASGISETGSDVSPDLQVIPLPRPKPRLREIIQAVNDETRDIVFQASLSDTLPTTFDARVLLAAGTGQFDGDPFVFRNLGANGIVGTTDATNFIVTFNIVDGEIQSDFPLGVVSLPYSTTPGFSSITDINGPYGSLAGNQFVGSDGFTLYSLSVNNDLTDPVYIFSGGQATASDVFRGNGNLRRYDLFDDYQFEAPMAFSRELVTGPQNGVVETDLMLAEPIRDSDNTVNALYAALMIEGSGVNQRSAVSVLANGFTLDDNGDYYLNASRRGSARPGSIGSTYVYTGGIRTVSDASGRHVFGSNGENFLLSAESTDLRNFEGVFNDTGTPVGAVDENDLVSSTLHIADLAGKEPLSDLNRDNRQLTGYSSGLVQSRIFNSNSAVYVPVRSITPLDTRMSFNDDGHMGAELLTYQVNTTAGFTDPALAALNLAFGEGLTGNSISDTSVNAVLQGDSTDASFTTNDVGGGAAFIDDDNYGASQNRNYATSFAVVNDGDTQRAVRSTQTFNPHRGYLISGEMVEGTYGFRNCECEFLEWGWWGTRFRADGDDTLGNDRFGDGNRFQAVVHLGSWVVGDVTREVEMPTSGSATYVGDAIGTVARETNQGTARYIEHGDLTASVDFGTRTGSIAINNFDGNDFSGNFIGASVGGLNGIAGTISNQNANLTGSISGAFVRDGNDPVGGLIGSFGYTGTNQVGTGVFGAERR